MENYLKSKIKYLEAENKRLYNSQREYADHCHKCGGIMYYCGECADEQSIEYHTSYECEACDHSEYGDAPNASFDEPDYDAVTNTERQEQQAEIQRTLK
jgi:CCR4-NOT transcriptional regulation complex NOT5 subunit